MIADCALITFLTRVSSHGTQFRSAQAMSPDDYRRVMKVVEEAILSTDLATYFDKYKKFTYCVENGEFDWQNDDKKDRK